MREPPFTLAPPRAESFPSPETLEPGDRVTFTTYPSGDVARWFSLPSTARVMAKGVIKSVDLDAAVARIGVALKINDESWLLSMAPRVARAKRRGRRIKLPRAVVFTVPLRHILARV